MPDRCSRWLGGASLLAIVVLGTSLRLLGIAFGLPYHHHWDEVWITDSVLGMMRRHDGVPASYQYGAPLMRLTELALVLMRAVRGSSGDLAPVEAQSSVFLAGRVVTAVVSSTGIVAAYVAGRRPAAGSCASMARALTTALLYAVASELVLHARYAVTDACLASLTTWTLAFATIYLERGRLAWGWASVAVAGVACAFKAPGVVTVLIPVVAALVLWRRAPRSSVDRRRHAGLLLAAGPVVVATFVALNPHVVDHTQAAVHDLSIRYWQTRNGGFSSVYLRQPGLPHLASALTAIWTQFPSRSVAVSLAVSAVSTWGLVRDVRGKDAATATGLVYAALLVLSVALPNRTFLYRNYLVVVPVLCVGFGSGVVAIGRLVGARLAARPRLRPVVLAGCGLAAGVALVALPLSDALAAQRDQRDPRVRALDWIAAHAGADAPAEVGLTWSVFGKDALGAYPGLQDLVQTPRWRITRSDLDSCPEPSGGPPYLVDASYRDTTKAPADDPWQERWLFGDCPGYEVVARFEPDLHEINLRAYPTWPGRVSAIVLRRSAP